MQSENAGLYWDDGLGILQNLSGLKVESIRKRIIKIFKGCGLNIAIKMILKTTDFLNVRFDLVNNILPTFIINQTVNQFIFINNQIIHSIF